MLATLFLVLKVWFFVSILIAYPVAQMLHAGSADPEEEAIDFNDSFLETLERMQSRAR
jgi:heme/copper-type cytochrome/quinol oxidase subunit 3